MTKAVIGVIGGSGVYDLPGLENIHEEHISSPWGDPSDALRIGDVHGTRVVFLPRHGRGHALSPSGINYRANIDALKRAGVTDIISVSACGSFKAQLYPGLFVFVDQFVDRTHGRASSFFGNGCVAHLSLAHPVAPKLQARLADAATAEDIPFVKGGTYLCIEGPQFSSYAESLNYKNSGYDVIGMTAVTEAKLAREAEMSYAIVAMVTDYDCWHEDHDNVDVSQIINVAKANAATVSRLLSRFLKESPKEHEPCPIGSDRALDHAILTPLEARDPALLKKIEAIMGRLNTAQ